MVILDRIATVLQNRGREESISNVKVRSIDNIVYSKLDNWIDPKQPYQFIVELDEKMQALHIMAFPLFRLCKDGSLFTKLLKVNFSLGYSGLCVGPLNNILYFKIRHFWETPDGPKSEAFERLLIQCVKDIRTTEQVLLFETMTKVGLPEERAEQLVKNIFSDHFIAG